MKYSSLGSGLMIKPLGRTACCGRFAFNWARGNLAQVILAHPDVARTAATSITTFRHDFVKWPFITSRASGFGIGTNRTNHPPVVAQGLAVLGLYDGVKARRQPKMSLIMSSEWV
jgi:hypothetical protein